MIDEGNGEVIKRTSIIEMVTVYSATIEKLKETCESLRDAEAKLLAAFDNPTYKLKFSSSLHDRFDYQNPDEIIKRMHREAWAVIVDKASVRQVMSEARRKELDTMLERGADKDGHPLPPLTAENIVAMLETVRADLPKFMSESVKEVYDALVPRGREFGMGAYKTNQAWQLGSKVVLTHGLESCGASKWRVNHYREQMIRNLDNIFHMLDGKGAIATHYGPLIDAIMGTPKADGEASTEYFRVKMFKNLNLHIEFKRADLVDQFNLIAAGKELRK